MDGLAVGIMVHYVLPENHAHAGEVRAALVVRLLQKGGGPSGIANLTVFLDGQNDDPSYPMAVQNPDLMQWIPSVPYSAKPEPGTWHWQRA